MNLTAQQIKDKTVEIALETAIEVWNKNGESEKSIQMSSDDFVKNFNFGRREEMTIEYLVNKTSKITIANDLNGCDKSMLLAVGELLGVSKDLRTKPASRDRALISAIKEYYTN